MVLCQALYKSSGEEEWTELHEQVKSLQKKIGVKKAGQSVAGLGKVAWRKTQEESFSAKDEQVQAFDRRSAVRESLLSLWKVDINQAFCMCAKVDRFKSKLPKLHTCRSTCSTIRGQVKRGVSLSKCVFLKIDFCLLLFVEASCPLRFVSPSFPFHLLMSNKCSYSPNSRVIRASPSCL